MEKIKRFCRENARILLALGAVLAFCAVLPVMFAATAVPTGSWGLSFRTEGQPPVGNATAGALRQYDAVYVGDTEEKVIYLTFDAGYEAGYTEQILDVLKKHDVKAAFFVVGTYIENNPELVRRMAEEGHIVGNHTWHHYNMSQIADLQSFTRELQSVADQYREATGRGDAALLPAAAGRLQRRKPENGEKSRLSHRVLEPRLRRLEPRRAAHAGAGV